MSDQPALGAMPPRYTDRADKPCVEAATSVMARRCNHPVLFVDMQAAIDAYLAEAKRHGWNLS